MEFLRYSLICMAPLLFVFLVDLTVTLQTVEVFVRISLLCFVETIFLHDHSVTVSFFNPVCIPLVPFIGFRA